MCSHTCPLDKSRLPRVEYKINKVLHNEIWRNVQETHLTARRLAALPHRVVIPYNSSRITIVQGSPLRDNVEVGKIRGCSAAAQVPPAIGDAWECSFLLHPGLYTVELNGGMNTWHGILDLSLNDKPIEDLIVPEETEQSDNSNDQYVMVDDVLSEAAQEEDTPDEPVDVEAESTVETSKSGIDWFCDGTAYPVARKIRRVNIETGGWQRIRGLVTRKSDKANGYWICLYEIKIYPHSAADAPSSSPRAWSDAPAETSQSGDSQTVYDADTDVDQVVEGAVALFTPSSI